MAERKQPVMNAIEADLCDHWLDIPHHRCHNYWREEIELDERTEVDGHVMFGSYHPGVWRFCRTHARIFKRDRRASA